MSDETMAYETMAYVGTAPCGCLWLVLVDVPEATRVAGREIAGVIREGGRIERTTVEAARQTPMYCQAHAPAEAVTS